MAIIYTCTINVLTIYRSDFKKLFKPSLLATAELMLSQLNLAPKDKPIEVSKAIP
jgi:hypothetical protein